MSHICKVCSSENTEPDIKVDGRQRYKCLDCQVLFFDDGMPFKLERAEPVEIEQEPISQPEQLKIYRCKKCDFETPDKYKLISHYSSAHSWWHDKNRGKDKPPLVNAKISQQKRREREKPCRIRQAIIGLVASNSGDVLLEQIYNLLCKYIRDEPLGTVKALIRDKDTFTVDDLLKSAMEIAVAAILERAGEFEYMGNDTWRIKEANSVTD